MNTEYVDYYAYINSEAWEKKRQQYIEMYYQGRPTNCKICYAIGPVHIHHKTYARLGNEYVSDLIGICRNCHEMWHGYKRVSGLSKPQIPRWMKGARKQWQAHLSRHHLWGMRYSNPQRFQTEAMQFFSRFHRPNSKPVRY